MLNGLDLFSEKTMRGYIGKTRENHPCWKGGKIIDKDGYILVYAPDHAFPRKMRYIREHILVIENAIGRRLAKDECVHHKDHNRQNNSIENLELVKRGEHSKLHRKLDVKTFKRDLAGKFTCGHI